MANTAKNSTIIMKKKTTQGRKKIEIKKIANISNRQVTFSKRRGGLFKKASELCILTGAEVAIIVHSLGKRIFAFGHPSVDSVIDRYTTGSSASSSLVSKPTQLSAAKIHEHNLQYAKLCKELEAEKKKNEILEGAKLVSNVNNFWWDEPVDHLGLEELEQYMTALEELRKNVLMRADELALLKNPPLPFNNVHMNNMTSTVGCDDLISNQMSNQHSTAIIPSDGLGKPQV